VRQIAKLLFVVVGLVNALPVLGVLGAQRLELLYGMPFAGDDLVLLMRHRAVLFGLVGGLLLAAAFLPALRVVATFVGLGSMLSFVVLALPLDGHGAAIQRVFWADVVASAALVGAWWLSSRQQGAG
jgi:hypothetical protein